MPPVMDKSRAHCTAPTRSGAEPAGSSAPPPAAERPDDAMAVRERIVSARYAVLDACADGLPSMRGGQCLKGALDHADLLANIAESHVHSGGAGGAAARGRLLEADETIGRLLEAVDSLGAARGRRRSSSSSNRRRGRGRLRTAQPCRCLGRPLGDPPPPPLPVI